MKTARIDEIHSWQFGTEKERLEWLKPRVQKELSDLHREIHDKEKHEMQSKVGNEGAVVTIFPEHEPARTRSDHTLPHRVRGQRGADHLQLG